MTTHVDIAASFNKELRRLARKYPSVADAVDELIAQLESDNRPGIKMTGLGHAIYKVRLPNRSARRGKRGGFRVIYEDQSGTLVLLLIIYSKTEQADIPDHVIRRLISDAY
ncbi:MAG: type II toxin-antitoxin system RelE/ParE family toxin [Chloroflexi bacterium]|nr:type II toxin-antitoxin system RelE/ParE family toxin [Chloroflexota bacterium]